MTPGISEYLGPLNEGLFVFLNSLPLLENLTVVTLGSPTVTTAMLVDYRLKPRLQAHVYLLLASSLLYLVEWDPLPADYWTYRTVFTSGISRPHVARSTTSDG